MELIAIKNLGKFGRVVIPYDLRVVCGFEPGVLVTISVKNGDIVVRAIERG